MMLAGMVSALAAVPTSQTIADGNAADANGKYTISVASSDDHTYQVFQILTGTLIAGENKLGNPKWGADAKGTTGTDTGVKAFLDSITAANLSNVQINDLVEAQLADNAAGQGTVKAGTSMDVVPGYYLIVDTTENLAEGESKSLNIVAVFNDITIATKRGTTESDKKVDDNDADKAADNSEWIDSADYSIGDTVPYKLSATIAEDYANYTKGYKLTFHDTMGPGLTFNADSVVVKVNGTTITNPETGDPYYRLVTTGLTGGETFQVKFDNLKNITSVAAGSVITVEFNATLNENAVVTVAGNPNTSKVTFTNNPNDAQAGEDGETPEDTVIVFTYKTVFNKVDGEGKPLTGADFTLYKNTGTAESPVWTDVTTLHTGTDAKNPSKTIENLTKGENSADNAKFTFAGLDAGQYKLVESTTPVGYNTIADQLFTITAEHQVLADDPQLTSLAGADGAEFTMTRVENTVELDADITNNQGSTLPSTGGIGTTLFYIGGGILVLAAVILLVTKRRMSAND